MISHWTLRPVQARHCFRLALNSVNRHCAKKQAFLLSRGCKDSRTFARQVSMDDCDHLKDAKAVCAPLLDDSIFNQCRCQVDPMPFYMNCLYDMVYLSYVLWYWLRQAVLRLSVICYGIRSRNMDSINATIQCGLNGVRQNFTKDMTNNLLKLAKVLSLNRMYFWKGPFLSFCSKNNFRTCGGGSEELEMSVAKLQPGVWFPAET